MKTKVRILGCKKGWQRSYGCVKKFNEMNQKFNANFVPLDVYLEHKKPKQCKFNLENICLFSCSKYQVTPRVANFKDITSHLVHNYISTSKNIIAKFNVKKK